MLSHFINSSPLLPFFKSMSLEFQCIAIFIDNPNLIFWDSIRNFDFNFEYDFGFRAHQAGDMSQHFIRDPASISPKTRGV